MIDTLTTARALAKRGFTQDQAEGLTEAIRGAVSENVATKTDIGELKAGIAGIRAEMKTEIAGIRVEMKTEIAGIRVEMKTEIAGVKTEIAGVKAEIASLKVWLFSSIIVVAGFAITIDKLLK
jgi:predicted  nucleic acid-binding Zn-ribbon protein